MNKQATEKATAGQVKYLHCLYRSLQWDEETYRFVLDHDFGVDSTKDLTIEQAGSLISTLKIFLEAATAEMASHKQCGLIRHLWREIDYSQGRNGDAHLNAFLHKKFNRQRVEELTKTEAIKVIKMINQMTVQYRKREGKTTVMNRHARCLYCDRPIIWVELQSRERVCFDVDADYHPLDFHQCEGGVQS
ncbi:MAG TPA: DUF1018 domain-containing protein [Candidatus Limiplasma sp.]|nr:DUF1018 domain-containing protein [Candidatus Limiplasma sp.]